MYKSSEKEHMSPQSFVISAFFSIFVVYCIIMCSNVLYFI